MSFASRIGARSALLTTLTVAMLLAQGCKKQTAAVQPATQPNAGVQAVDLTALPDPLRQTLAATRPATVSAHVGAAWSAGDVAFAGDADGPVFQIARDYDQEMALPVRSIGTNPHRVVATIGPLRDGLLGGFAGDGTTDRPLNLPAGANATLALHAYAQDADQPVYRTTAVLRDADSGQPLAATPITIFVARPPFSLSVEVGNQQPGTLGRLISVHNDGAAAITDFSVRASPELEGRVQFQPVVDHADLPAGGDLSFIAAPVLDTDFTSDQGDLILTGAGQEQHQSVNFALPKGQHLFVATSFSTTNSSASGNVCTNNPNTNTGIGGPWGPWFPGLGDPFQMLQNFYGRGQFPGSGGGGGGGGGGADPHLGGGVAERGEGAGGGGGSGGGNNSGSQNTSSTPPDNSGTGDNTDNTPPDNGGSGSTTTGTNTNSSGQGSGGGDVVSIADDDGSDPTVIGGTPGTPTGTGTSGTQRKPRPPIVARPVNGLLVAAGKGGAPVSSRVASADGPATFHGQPPNPLPDAAAGAVARPRGLRVRQDYAAFRSTIEQDNEPEAMLAVGAGPIGSDQRVVLQTWHSAYFGGGGGNGGGRQILLRVWDGAGALPLSRSIILTKPGTFGQWPAALALPDGRGFVVWENSGMGSAPPALAYKISIPGYGYWSQVRSIPGGDDPAGNYDPAPLLAADGHILIFWQQGQGPTGKILFTRSTDAGDFAPAAPAKGLPPGASQPVVRLGDDGAIHLVCTAPADSSSNAAVYYAVSHDGGASFDQLTRLSPNTSSSPGDADAGEADMLVAGKNLQCAYRVGGEWASRIDYTFSNDGGHTWSGPQAVTSDDQYAEYPSLIARGGGASGGDRTEIRYYGGARSDRDMLPATAAPTTAPTTAAADMRRAVLKEYAIATVGNGADGQPTWSAPRRLLTHFPAIQSAWLEATFRMRSDRQDYHPYELRVLLNNVELIHQVGVIAEGTYLLPVNPAILASGIGGQPHNVVGLRSINISPTHYNTGADFRLQARWAYHEALVAADNQSDADALLTQESADVNHSRPDVGVFARLVEAPKKAPLLPAAPQIGQVIELPLLVANLGESAASDVVVQVHAKRSDGPAVGDAIALGTLAAGQIRDIDVKFPYGGEAEYFVVSTHPGPDFDPTNDIYQVSFVPPSIPTITAKAADPKQPVAALLPDDPAIPYRWRILDAQSGSQVATVERGQLNGVIPPGNYRLALQRYEDEGNEVTFPQIVQKTADQPLRASISTAVEITLPSWAPIPYRWELLPPASSANADKPVQWLYGRHTVMLVPPGDYRLAIWSGSSLANSRLIWPDPIHVDQDADVVVKLDSGVAPPPALAREPTPYLWGVWPANASADQEPLVSAQHDWRPLLVPPGRYRWGIRQTQYGSRTVLFPPISVSSAQLARGEMPATVQLLPVEWSAMPAHYRLIESETKKTIQQIDDGAASSVWVPAGNYDLAIQPIDYRSGELVFAKDLVALAGEQTRIFLDNGISIDAGANQSKLAAPYQVSFYRQGDKDPIQQLTDSGWGAALLPPGKYKVAFQPYQWKSGAVFWTTDVVVEPDKLAKLSLDSGIDVESGQIQPSLPAQYQLTFYRQGAKDPIQQLTNPGWGPALLPPGNYKVAFQPYQWKSGAVLWTTDVVVEPGKLAKLTLDSGIDVEPGQNLAKSAAPYQFTFYRNGEKDPIQQLTSLGWGPTLLPSGNYKVAFQPNQWNSSALVWRDGIAVEPGKLTTVSLDSGIDIEPGANQPKLPAPYQIHFYCDGVKDAIQGLTDPGWGVIVLPPGSYHVALQPTHWDSEEVIWPATTTVQPGQIAHFNLDTGIIVTGAAGLPEFSFQFLDDKGKAVQGGDRIGIPQVVPPGTYSVQISQPYGPWRDFAKGVIVQPGNFTQVSVDHLPAN